MTRTTKIALLVAVILIGAIFSYRYLSSYESLRNFPPIVADTFFNTNQIQLLSLSPIYDKELAGSFYGYRILGIVDMSDKVELAKMARSLDRAVDTNDMFDVRCFWPRHGIHAFVDGKSIDLLICFQCHRFIMYVDGEFKFKIDLNSTPKTIFDEPLKKAGITIDAPAMME